MALCHIVSVIACFLFPLSAVAESASLESQTEPKTQSASRNTPVYGDSMLLGMVGEASNLIPYLASDTASSSITGHLYVAPLKFDENIQPVTWAAERFELLDDGLLLRFTLKKGIYWEDGVELTADDAEFTYQMMIDPETPTAYAGDYKAIKEFRKIDKYTFEVAYEKPFPRSLSTWMGALLPKHKLQGLGGEGLRGTPLARKPISCGPYLLRNWVAGSQLTLTANSGYFEGRPFIDRLLYRIIPDTTTMFLELKAGKLDIMEALTALQYTYQAQKPPFSDEYATYRSLASTYTYLGYNLKSPLFSDVRVRQAFAYAINKQDIIKGALLEQGEATIGPYKPDSWIYNKNIQDYPYDPEKALALLAEAGWTRGKSGLLEKNGMPFSFTILTNQGNEQRVKTAIIIQSQLQNIGVEAKIRTVEWAAFLNQFVIPGFFDAVVLAWTIPHDPDGFDVWHSSRIGGGLNFTGYGNKEADACLEEGRSTFNQSVRKKAYDKFQEILHREQPYCFLYVPYQLSAVQKRFKGVAPAPIGIFYNSDRWWVPLDDQRYRIEAR